jgi:CHAT domain-containing protein/Flp pilus assembly protein TadD
MPGRAARGRLLWSCGLLLLWSLGCRGEEAAGRGADRQASADNVTDRPRAAPAAVVARCDLQTWRLAVRPGDYVHAVAGQGARDVAVTLTDAGGRRLLQVDSLVPPGASWRDEEVHWVADTASELRFEVTLLAGPGGPCPLRLAVPRPATAADRARVLAEAALARGHALRRTGDVQHCRTAIVPYESAEGAFAALGLVPRRAEVLFGLGLLHKDCLLDHAAALRALTSALPLFRGTGAESGAGAGGEAGQAAAGPAVAAAEAMIRQHLGETRFALGDLDGAISEYRRALELRRRTGDRAGEALTANNLGHTLHLRGRYDEAATLFDRAIALGREGDDPAERAKTRLNRGHLHRELGETERARGHFRQALGLFRQARDRPRQAATLNALGLLALGESRPGEALAPLRQALALRAPESRGRAVTLTTLAVAYRELGRLPDARRAYAEALPIFRRLGDDREQAQSLANLGWLEIAAGRDQAVAGPDRLALAHFNQALGLFAALADPPGLAWTLRGKAEVLRRCGDLAAARAVMEEALTAVERHRFGQTSYATRAAFFATHQGSYDFLIDLLMEMHRRAPAAGHAAAALGVSERALARSLLDGLAAGGTDLRARAGGGATELLNRERELEATIESLVDRQTRLAARETADAPVAQLRAVEQELERHWEELDRVRGELRAADPRYAALTQPRPASAAEIQRLLDRDTLLLEYRLGEERSFLWAVTSASLESFELPGRAAIEASVRQACARLARRGSKAELAARPPLARLSTLLLGPVAHLLPGKRLLVVGDGVIQNLPFAVLSEPGAGEPLVARHEIVSLPSVSVLGVLRSEAAGRAPAPRTLWVLADPDFGDGPLRLPYSREEAAAILGFVPASGRLAVLGRAASRPAVLHGALRDFRLLHFATHGSFAATEPGGGRLVLAQRDRRGRPVSNGFLHLADIYRLDLRADLVVLSACQSALGREVRGEGMMGMTRGFFYAGAERVLVSLWNVNDRVTAELMRRFYRGLLVEGLTPAAALRSAQDSIRREPRWHSPYYWAGFTLQGEWRD